MRRFINWLQGRRAEALPPRIAESTLPDGQVLLVVNGKEITCRKENRDAVLADELRKLPGNKTIDVK